MAISTIFVRKASNYDSILANTKELITKFGTKPELIEIQKVIEMTKEEFEEFKSNLLNDMKFITDNKEYTYFLVKEKGTDDKKGIVVDTEGFDFPRYTGVFIEDCEVYHCKRCNKYFMGHPAISRKDNKLYVCSECGTKEALEDYEHREFIEYCFKLQETANEIGAEIIIKLPDGYERRIKPRE